MFGINHNHGNDTGNGNQSESGDKSESEEDRPERPGLLYGEKLHTIRTIPVHEGLRVDTIPRDGSGGCQLILETEDSDSETEADR